MTPIVTQILSYLTAIGNILIILLVISMFQKKESPLTKLKQFFQDKGLLIGFIISLIATIGSLYFSEIAKYDPCKLCWIQRIFMYPLALIFFIALIKKDRNIAVYPMALSTVGGIVALYHYYLQLGGQSPFPCSVVGYSSACSQRFVMELGYITIPMMALTAFVLIILSMILVRKSSRATKVDTPYQ